MVVAETPEQLQLNLLATSEDPFRGCHQSRLESVVAQLLLLLDSITKAYRNSAVASATRDLVLRVPLAPGSVASSPPN